MACPGSPSNACTTDGIIHGLILALVLVQVLVRLPIITTANAEAETNTNSSATNKKRDSAMSEYGCGTRSKLGLSTKLPENQGALICF